MRHNNNLNKIILSSGRFCNQEDSLLINNSAIEKGMFRAQALKKYIEQITKNPASSQTGSFMRPDRNKVDSLKDDANYNKLNEEGYVDVETPIKDGDVVIGMVNPKPTSSEDEKPYKDSSTIYKSLIPGAIDKVITGINADGYPIIKLRVRSERIPQVGDKFSCYDKETEVLTDKGWIYFKDLTKEHAVATLVNGEFGDTLEYENPSEIQKYPYKGKMYHIKSNQVDLCVTPNHMMYVSPRGKTEADKKYKLERADKILGQIRYYQKNVFQYGDEITRKKRYRLPAYKEYPDRLLDLKPWLLFLGIWYAEGYAETTSVRFAANKQRVKDCLDKVCDRMGYEVKKCRDKKTDAELNSWRIYDKQLLHYMKPLSVGAINKSLPAWVWKLTTEQARWLIKGMMLGDGHWMKNITTRRYDTSSKKLADDFQRLCLHAGWSANMTVKYPKGHQSMCLGKVITTNADALRLTIVTAQNNPKVNKDKKNKLSDEMIDYNGKVYCCTVSSGIIYVRRNGIPVFSGNSRSGQKGTCGFKPHRADMPFSESGLIPDIILNPNAIPKRMTIGQLVECLLAKVCAIKGVYGDATPFVGIDINKINQELVDAGYDEWANETMYNGMNGQKMNVKIFIGPTYYQRLKQMVGDKTHCLSTDHEVLTRNGWKFNHQLSMNDKIATLVDEKLVYQKPIKILNYPNYKGEMYHIKTQQIDLMVTPKHRMWVSKRYGRENKWLDYDFELARDISGQRRKYKKDAIWENEDYQFKLPSVNCRNGKIYPEKDVNMKSWLRFFGIWIAEGWTRSCVDNRWPDTKSHLVEICQCKQRVIDVLIPAITKLGYHYRQDKTKTKFIVVNKQLHSYMKQFSVGAPNKFLPDWVWRLSSNQARILLESMILGDGSYHGSSVVYYTSSIKLADNVMQLALHCGWSSNKWLHSAAGNETVIEGRNVKSNYDMWRLAIIKSKNNPEVNHGHTKTQDAQIEEIIKDYDKPVFCLEVPNGVFYVRRNGKPVWTGNSRARGPTQLLTRQPPEGRLAFP